MYFVCVSRLAILSNFPETLQPSQYSDLLPEVRLFSVIILSETQLFRLVVKFFSTDVVLVNWSCF